MQRPIPYRLIAWLGLTIAWASVALMGVAALAPRLMAEMGMRAESVGWFSGIVWITALLVTPFAGSLSKRRDPWQITQSCLMLCSIGLICIAIGNPWLFWLGAILVGAGQAFEAPPASQLLSQYSHPEKRAFSFSLKQAGVQLGALTASLTLPLLAMKWTPSAALWVVAGVLLAFVVSLNYGRKQYPHTLTLPENQSPHWLTELRQGLVDWWPLLRSQPGLLRLSLSAATFGATQVCINSFMVTWLVEARHMPLTEAGVLAACMQASGLFSRPLWGWVASHSTSALRVLSGLGLCMSVCGVAMGFWGSMVPEFLLLWVLVVYGLSASGWNGVYLAEIAHRSPANSVGSYTAVATMPLYLGLILGPIIFTVLTATWGFSVAWLCLGISGFMGAINLTIQSKGPTQG